MTEGSSSASSSSTLKRSMSKKRLKSVSANEPSSSRGKENEFTLRDLPEEEKNKVARLAQRLISLGRDYETLKNALGKARILVHLLGN